MSDGLPTTRYERRLRKEARRRQRRRRALLRGACICAGLAIIVVAFVIGVGYGRITTADPAGSRHATVTVRRSIMIHPATTNSTN